MDKNPEAFRTISEAADDIGLPQHVLRFWETRFSQIKPLKRAGGRRYYRSGDIELLRAVKKLLHTDGYTIKGVHRRLKEKGGRALLVAAHGSAGQEAMPELAAAQFDFDDGDSAASDGAAGTVETERNYAVAELPSRGVAAVPFDAGFLHAAYAELARCRQILRDARSA